MKKNNRHEKENYRPVSIIPVISKILERCLYDQIRKTMTIHCLDIRWATERDIALNIH